MIPLDLTKPATKLALGLGAVLVLVLLYLAVFYGGYRHGHSTAANEGNAKYAKLEKDHAAALAEANAKALDRYVLATQRANAIAADLAQARRTLATARAQITKEIPHATADLDACRFGADFRRVYNAALGLRAGSLPAPAGSGGTSGSAAQAGPADAGIRDLTSVGAPVTASAPTTASATDLLTHVRDVGQWCQGVAAQRDALLKLLTEEAR